MPTLRERVGLLIPLALILIPFLILPALFGLYASFTNYAPGELHVQFVGLNNYATVTADHDFQRSWQNIGLFLLISVPAELIFGVGLAYLLREAFRGRALLRVVLLIPWLASPIANGVMWHFLLNLQWGLVNYFVAWVGATMPSPLGSTTFALPATVVTDVWRKVPLTTFLLLPGMLSIPSEHWEYATLEGASVLNRLRDIALPWLRPLLLTIAMLLIGDGFGTSDSILVLTGGGPGSATYTPALYSYLQAFQYNLWTTGATSAWFIVAAVLLTGLIYLRMVRPEGAR